VCAFDRRARDQAFDIGNVDGDERGIHVESIGGRDYGRFAEATTKMTHCLAQARSRL
jgi:hypothetical protein